MGPRTMLGTFAVQTAKSFGARVTGVYSGRNVALVRSDRRGPGYRLHQSGLHPERKAVRRHYRQRQPSFGVGPQAPVPRLLGMFVQSWFVFHWIR